MLSILQRIKTPFIKLLCMVSLTLLLVSETFAVPITYNFSQSGFVGGGTITGSFTGDDVNADGELVFLPVLSQFEVSAFMATWSGNATVPATSWSFSNLIGLVYELGTGDIGDDGPLFLEGIGALNLGGFRWISGIGPGGFGAAPGGGIQGPSGVIITSSNLVNVGIPVPTTLALFIPGLAGLGFARRKTA